MPLDIHQSFKFMDEIPKAIRWKLDKELDFENTNHDGQIVPRHLGAIAESMHNWEASIGDHLGLTEPERRDITEGKHKDRPDLQR